MKHHDKEHFFKCRATYYNFDIEPRIAIQFKSPPGTILPCKTIRRKMVKKESKYV